MYFSPLKYESVLTKVTTLVSLNKTLPSSGLTDSYVIYICNETDMLPVDSLCFALVSQFVMCNTQQNINS